MEYRYRIVEYGPIMPNHVDLKGALQEITREIADISISNVRNIIAEETDGTGRLAASVGKWDPSYLKEENLEASPDDAYWREFEVGNTYRVEYGSNVEYAEAVENGWVIEEPRVIFLNGRFVTVRPQQFGGIYAFERGHAAVTNTVSQAVFQKHFKQIGWI